jgi:hypothetical protein
MPTPVVRKKPVSILAICVAAFGIFWVIAYASDHVSAAHRQTALAAFTADLQPRGKLAAPEAFQERCGAATETSQKKTATVLTYDRANRISVHFAPSKEVAFTRQEAFAANGSFHNIDRVLPVDVALDELQCKVAP